MGSRQVIETLSDVILWRGIPVLAYLPAAIPQQRCDAPIAITPVLRRQFNHRSGQLILVGPIHRLIPLCPSPLPQQPAAMPFRYSILLPCTPHRTTPPLRA